MLRTSVDLEVLELLGSQLVLGQHTLNSLLNGANRVGLQQFSVVDRLEATGVTGVAVGPLLLQLGTGQGNLLSVDDDDGVTHVNVGCEGGLVLAAQQDCGLACETAENNIRGIDDVPLALVIAGLRSVSAQNFAFSRFGWR